MIAPPGGFAFVMALHSTRMSSTLLLDPARTPIKTTPKGARRVIIGWLPFLFVAALYIGACVGPAIFDQNEAQYAGAAREMLDRPGDYQPSAHGQLERGQWLVPTNDGIPRLQKPPLVYWGLMASMRVFGVNEFGARLPNALVTLLWFGATVLLGRRLGGAALGNSAALILATMAGVFIFSHLIAPEPYLAAFLTLTFWCFLSACHQPARAARWMRWAWLFMALGSFCKGFHGALYPLAVAGILAWLHPQTRPVCKQLLRPGGPLIFAAIIVPWYAVIEWKYPGFLRDQLINEQVGHVFNHRYPPDSQRVPMLTFWLQHLGLLFPWTLFIPAALWASRRRLEPEVSAGGSVSGVIGRDMLAAWVGVTVLSILFSSLQDYYLMSVWGVLALWLARPWAQPSRAAKLPAWMTAGPGAALAVAGLGAFALALWLGGPATAHPAANIDELTPGRDSIMGVITGFSTAIWAQLLPLLWGAGAAFFIGGLGLVFLARRGQFAHILPAAALMMIVALGFAARGLCLVEDLFSLKQAALTINRQARPEAVVVCCGIPTDNPSLFFYLDRPVHWLGASPRGEFASRELKIGAGLFLTEEDFIRRWQSGDETFLIIEEDDLAKWRGKLNLPADQTAPIARVGTRLVLVNR
jgi:4-amino-4-deoxy-L-arabinose transferase-like glycosyltransferase